MHQAVEDGIGDDTLDGGHDKIYGGKGDDILDGGAGNDLLVGGSGADTYMGGAGSDMIYADRADTAIDGGSEADDAPPATDTLSYAKFTDSMLEDGTGITLTLEGNASVTNIERLVGTAEADSLTGTNAAPETIEGGDGGDTLVGGTGTGDTVSYADSDDDVRVDLGDGTTDAGTGSSARGGHAGGDTISGFENVIGSAYGDDLTARSNDTDATTDGPQGSTLWGLAGDDELEGGIGNDTLEGGAGADELDGGLTRATPNDETTANTQENTLSYADSDAGVRVDLATASASGGHADGDEIATYDLTIGTGDDEQELEVATFVNVTGSMYNDHLAGDMFANHLAGGGGNDSLRGAAGADLLVGGPGADMLDGGEDRGERNNLLPRTDTDDDGDIDDDDGAAAAASEDWAVYRGAAAGVTVDLNTNTGTAGDAMGDTLRNIELIWGSTHGDTFIASAGHDVIHGDGGSDTVSYEASRHGVTVVLPGGDDDTAQFTEGDSTATPPTEDMFIAATDTIVGAWRAGTADRPAAVEADDGVTSTRSYAEGDVLASIENVTGSRDDDMITGDGVPNVLKGMGGNDTLNGGDEDDKLYGGDGNDILGARDTNNDGTDDVTEAGNDMLMGGAGNDTLRGGAGNDTLAGGAGDDDLTGGGGVDTFVFSPDNGSDIILGFEVGTAGADADTDGTGDKIDLSAFNIDADDLAGLLTDRGGNVIVNLEDHGGGRITIQDTTKEALMTRSLIHDDMQEGEGVGADGTDGVFIV